MVREEDVKAAQSLGVNAVGAAWTPMSDTIKLMNESPLVVFTKVWMLNGWFDDVIKERRMRERKNKTIYFVFLLIVLCVFLFMMQK